MKARGSMGPLAAVRTTPELIVWGLAVFLAGVVLVPVIHLVGHRGDDHVHAAAHLAGLDHDHAHDAHGAGALEHFGLAWLESDPPALPAPVVALVEISSLEPSSAVVRRYELHPIRSQAP